MASNDPRHIALAALSRREHSRLELTQKLKKAGFSNEDIEPLLEDLTKRNWLSEERFINAFVRNRFNQGYGPLKIRFDLQQKGISGEMISNALLEYQDKWKESARSLKIRRFGENVSSDQKTKAKQMRFLSSRGFLPDHIRYALKS
jgi:regulatory protein